VLIEIKVWYLIGFHLKLSGYCERERKVSDEVLLLQGKGKVLPDIFSDNFRNVIKTN
jgi:hypothetical protein